MISEKITPAEICARNGEIVNFVCAMRGYISPNFRHIAFSVRKNFYNVQFVLEKEDEADRERISDIVTDYEAVHGPFMFSDDEFDYKVIVTSRELPELPDWGQPWSVLYCRYDEFPTV